MVSLSPLWFHFQMKPFETIGNRIIIIKLIHIKDGERQRSLSVFVSQKIKWARIATTGSVTMVLSRKMMKSLTKETGILLPMMILPISDI